MRHASRRHPQATHRMEMKTARAAIAYTYVKAPSAISLARASISFLLGTHRVPYARSHWTTARRLHSAWALLQPM